MKKIFAMLLTFSFLTGCVSTPVETTEPLPQSTQTMASPEPEVNTPTPSVSPSESPSPEIPEPVIDDPVQLLLDSLTTEEKVGQLLLAGIEGTSAGEDAAAAIQQFRVGSVILFRRNVESCAQTAQLVSQLHALNGDGIPLIIASDEEGGLVSRMPGEVTDLPSAYTYGSVGDEALCLRLGQALAAQCSTIGVNCDFAPVADVWSNPDNTVIGKRAFSTDADTVARLVPQVMEGLTQYGVIPVVKHFPGHGDTAVDSHYDLPVVTKTLDELEAVELKPFRAAIEAGAPAVMVAHLLVREMDDTLPATLSPKVVNGLLREELGFEGVVFTDDLTMGAISDSYGMGEAAVLAVEAGCDILLVCHGLDNLRAAYEALLEAVTSGRIPLSRLDESVYRILSLKSDYGLTNDPVPQPDVAALNELLDSVLP